MPTESSSGKKPTSRRYSPEEKAAAVRMVRALRAELGKQGTVWRATRNPVSYVCRWRACNARSFRLPVGYRHRSAS